MYGTSSGTSLLYECAIQQIRIRDYASRHEMHINQAWRRTLESMPVPVEQGAGSSGCEPVVADLKIDA